MIKLYVLLELVASTSGDHVGFERVNDMRYADSSSCAQAMHRAPVMSVCVPADDVTIVDGKVALLTAD